MDVVFIFQLYQCGKSLLFPVKNDKIENYTFRDQEIKVKKPKSSFNDYWC